MKNNTTPTPAAVDDPPSDDFAFDAMEDNGNAEASNASQPGVLNGKVAACAWIAPRDNAQVRLSGPSEGRNNLYAGLSIRDQIDLGLVQMIERGQDPVGRPTIELEMTLVRQSRFLAMADGQDAILHVTCLGTEGEWQRLQVRKVIWNPRRA